MKVCPGRIQVCEVGDVKSGEMLGREIDGLPRLCIYRVGDQFYCTADLCTHGAASLSEEGELHGYIIQCTMHDGQFDIRTGEVRALPCTEPLRSFPVTVEGDVVFIDVT